MGKRLESETRPVDWSYHSIDVRTVTGEGENWGWYQGKHTSVVRIPLATGVCLARAFARTETCMVMKATISTWRVLYQDNPWEFLDTPVSFQIYKNFMMSSTKIYTKKHHVTVNITQLVFTAMKISTKLLIATLEQKQTLLTSTAVPVVLKLAIN